MKHTILGLSRRLGGTLLLASAVAACDSDSSGPGEEELGVACTVDTSTPVASNRSPGAPSLSLGALGLGAVTNRFTSELNVGARYAYTGAWGSRGGNRGNVVNVWDTQGNVPTLVRTLTIAPDTATTTGDVQVSDDGRYLFVATEPVGSLRTYSLADPSNPQLVSVFRPSGSPPSGVHTAEIARVNGQLHAFLSINPGPAAARLVIVDLTDPAKPQEVLSQQMGTPYIHDVFVRDGLLFTALWNGGLTIWDIGACDRGTVRSPVAVSNVVTRGGQVHNVWWYHASNGNRHYAFVGQEGPGSTGSTSSGDLHVVDISDPFDPTEVAIYSVPGAGVHNFSMDESRGLLFAAYYNGGVRALDVRGDLGACAASERGAGGLCDLRLMGREVARWLTEPGQTPYIWGVQYLPGTGALFASDMLTGLYRLDTAPLPK